MKRVSHNAPGRDEILSTRLHGENTGVGSKGGGFIPHFSQKGYGMKNHPHCGGDKNKLNTSTKYKGGFWLIMYLKFVDK